MSSRIIPDVGGSFVLILDLTPPPYQMAETNPDGCTQPNGWESAKWLLLSQMAVTQPNGCYSAKLLRLSQKRWDSAKYLGIGWNFIKVFSMRNQP